MCLHKRKTFHKEKSTCWFEKKNCVASNAKKLNVQTNTHLKKVPRQHSQLFRCWSIWYPSIDILFLLSYLKYFKIQWTFNMSWNVETFPCGISAILNKFYTLITAVDRNSINWAHINFVVNKLWKFVSKINPHQLREYLQSEHVTT